MTKCRKAFGRLTNSLSAISALEVLSGFSEISSPQFLRMAIKSLKLHLNKLERFYLLHNFGGVKQGCSV